MTGETPAPLDMAAVEALAEAGPAPAELSAFGDSPCLLLSADRPAAPAVAARVADWLRRLACPSVAIADDARADAVVAACDVVVPDLEAAAPVVAAIARNPMAAAVLVQVLRVTEELPLEPALTVESMAYATLQGGAEYARWLAGRGAAAEPGPAEDGPAVELRREGGTLALTLNRPGNRNAMSVEMRDALVEALGLARADERIAAVEIDGRGRCFSTGGDLSEFGSVPDAASGHLVRSLRLPGRVLAACAGRAHARVHGACIGSGMEFPAFAGRVTAAGDAHFQLPEVGMGLIPGAGGCISIARRIGRQRLAWLALTGRRIRATTALEWGLVDAID